MLELALLLAACTPADPIQDTLAPTESPVGTPPETDVPDPDPDCVPAGAVAINELSPSNVAALLDEDGDSPDWIELTNHGAAQVALAGWALTDDHDDPMKWLLPEIFIDPGQLLVVFASGKDRRDVVGSWDTRVDQGDDWRYLEVVAAPDPGWFAADYDDSSWPTGPSGFGYGDLDDATEVLAETVYVRTTFDVTADELDDLAALLLHVDYDDAFVAYLNGVEVARAGIGVPGVAPAWTAYADVGHDAQLLDGVVPTPFDLAALGLLNDGTNTLAVEVHDASAGSLDLTLIPFLTLGFDGDRGGRTSTVLHLGTHAHTNFSLEADGERVRLYDPAGCEVDDLEPVPLLADQSYGRQPDGTGALGYFLEPTPGLSNTTESRPGFSVTPTFDPAPGAAVGGATITVLATAGADVHTTWAGYEPLETDALYTAPLPTGSEGEAVVLRARAWEDGLWPSRIATGTWMLREPGTMPIVSLVTDPANLWDDEIGIYTRGAEDEGPPYYYGANFWEDWERPVHMAEWEPDGTMGFAVDAGIQIHGNYTRSQEQKSLLVELSSGFGDDTLEHDVFPGLGHTSFDRLLLRAAGNDWLGCGETWCTNGAHLRDGLMQEIAADADLETLAWRPAEVYLNGEYWGVYHLNERSDDSYIEAHHGETDIDLLETGGVPVDGDNIHWLATMDYLRTHDLAISANYAHVQTLIDVDQLQSYLAYEVFYANTDWPGNNVKFWRPRTADGRWRWMLYDTDFGLGLYGALASHDSLAAALAADGPSWPNPPWSTELFRLMMTSPEFSAAFVNRYADALNTTLTPAVTRAALDDLEGQLAPQMPHHIERWGSWTDGVAKNTLAPYEWETQIANVDTWLADRPGFARQHVVTAFGLAGTWTLSLDAEPAGAGSFELTTTTVGAPFTGTYFQGVPVSVTAVPAAGYTFVGWSQPDVSPTATVILDPGGPLALVALFE